MNFSLWRSHFAPRCLQRSAPVNGLVILINQALLSDHEAWALSTTAWCAGRSLHQGGGSEKGKLIFDKEEFPLDFLIIL
jgi:hypothetical protein